MKNIHLESKIILVTGAAGFIGSNLIIRLLNDIENIQIVGVDNLNDYYDVSIKEYHLREIQKKANSVSGMFKFVKATIADKTVIENIFSTYHPSIVVNFAAQAGVRYSIINPDAYIETNIQGFYNILEGCRHSFDNGCKGVEHLIYASSSSVYGDNEKVPYNVEDKTDRPVSLYAATKKTNELLAYSYSKLYKIPSTGLRFFTVYGPGGRPDMAYFKFTNKLLSGETIEIFNHGNCRRDFTYIDDIIEGVVRVIQGVPEQEEAPYAIYNIGNGKPINLLEFVDILQQELVRSEVLPSNFDFSVHKKLVGMQPGDVEITYADIKDLEFDFGFRPSTSIRTGIRKFVEWYKEFYQNKNLKDIEE